MSAFFLIFDMAIAICKEIFLFDQYLSCSATNQAGCALRFLFPVTLKQPDIFIQIPLHMTPSKIPELPSRQEIESILNACASLRHRTILTTIYASGLRVSELCQRQISDIDSQRMMLRVVNGKAGKDRHTFMGRTSSETGAAYI